jgi:transcriptional regulator with PAS, ATPase and Fis domain
MTPVLESAAFAASNSRPVLLIGETGTGKGVLAQAIHKAYISDPKRLQQESGPFIRFQPSFLNSDLIASELFGHLKGAFTGANEERKGLIGEAHQGTLFIDEVDELPQEVQVLLLNVLQEKTFRRLGANSDSSSDFRLIAATNRTKVGLVTEKQLRRDFYHRIAHCTIEIPPLRKRPEDISLLAQGFVQSLVLKEKLGVQGLTDEACGVLNAHYWPGNIRELQAVVEGGVYYASYKGRRFVEAADIEISNNDNLDAKNGIAFRKQVREFEEELVLNALRFCNNNQSQAAAKLQIDRSSFRRILSRIENK